MILPQIESIAFDGLLPSLEKFPEISKQAITTQVLDLLAKFTAQFPLSTQPSNKSPEDHEKVAAQIVSKIVGLVINDLLTLSPPVNLNIQSSLVEQSAKLFNSFKGLNVLNTTALKNITTKLFQSGEWEELFEHEDSYDDISYLAAYTSSQIHKYGLSKVALRDDIDSVFAGTALTSGTDFSCYPGWYCGSDPYKFNSADQDIFIGIASAKDLRSGTPTRIKNEEFSELIESDDVRTQLNGMHLNYYPIVYGSTYFGGIYHLISEESDQVAFPSKDLKLIANAAASALARVVRIRQSSKEFDK